MAKQILNIQRQTFPTISDAYNNLLGIKDESHFINISLFQLDEIEEQPFPINESKIQQIADSIENVGVIEPLIVVKNGDRYKILSGRHRFRACQKLGKTEVPCYVKDVSEDVARYILIATNTDRNNEYAPSVYARAYAEQMELMKKLGKKTVSAIAEQNGVNRKQIYRYIRLTYLNDEFMQFVDNGIIAFLTGVELSYLDEQQQNILLDFVKEKKIEKLLTLEVAQRFHKISSYYENDIKKFKDDIEKIFFNRLKETADEPKQIRVSEPDEEKVIQAFKDDISSIKTPDVWDNVESGTKKSENISKKADYTEEKAKNQNDNIITEETDITESELGQPVPVALPDTENSVDDELIKGYMIIALQQAGVKLKKSELDEIFANNSADMARKAYINY